MTNQTGIKVFFAGNIFSKSQSSSSSWEILFWEISVFSRIGSDNI